MAYKKYTRTKRGRAQDRRLKAKYKPTKKFKRGLGHRGDWKAKKARNTNRSRKAWGVAKKLP